MTTLKKASFLFVLFGLMINISARSQEKTENPSGLSISTNVFKDYLNEYNIILKYQTKTPYSYGLSLEKIHYNKHFDPLPLSSSQEKFPGTVYDGYAVNLILQKKHLNNNSYSSIRLKYKFMEYDNLEFTDINTSTAIYTRSEQAHVIGADYIVGTRLIDKTFFCDFQLGLGLRYRLRYTDVSKSEIIAEGYHPPIGERTFNQFYPVLSFGITVGLNFDFK